MIYLCMMNLREIIVNKVLKEGGFWSYNKSSIHCTMSDDQLIEAVLELLDLEDINLLFQQFSSKKIKQVWLHTMVIQDEYYQSLNRFYAWYYFNIQYPDRYLKAMKTRHFTKIAK